MVCSNFCVTDTSPWIIRSDQGWGVTRPCSGEGSTLEHTQSELCKYLIQGSLTLGIVQLQLTVSVTVSARPLLSARRDWTLQSSEHDKMSNL